jgi:hypothetical protein
MKTQYAALIFGVSITALLLVLSYPSVIYQNQTPRSLPNTATPHKYKRSLSAPVTAPEPYNTVLDKEFEKLRPGRIVFNTPNQMQVNDSELVVVRISDDLRRDLTAGLGANSQTDKIRVGSFLRTSLTGNNFKTQPESELNQALPKGGVAEWRWIVIPTEPGEQTLYLTVYVRIKLPNQPEEFVLLGTYDRKIEVQVNPKDWLDQNWQWIVENWDKLTVIFGLLLAAIAAGRRLTKRLLKTRISQHEQQ